MSTQIGVSRLLQSKFISGKQKNDKFSLRAFAQKLKLSPGTLSQILNGKRKISHKKAREICELLELSPIEREQFLKDFNVKAAPEVKTVFLSDDKFQVIAEWYYLAILALSETIDFKFNTDWISSRLNLEKNIVIEAIKKLLELKLLAFDEDGKIYRTQYNLHTSDDKYNIALRYAHKQSLHLAEASIERDAIETRDITFMNMSIDVSQLGKAKELIRRFRNEMCELLENNNKTEVYRLCIQLFPLSVREKK